MRLEGKVSASVDVVSGVPPGSVLGSLLFIFYSLELFHIDGHHVVGYTDDTTIYTVIHSPLSRLQSDKIAEFGFSCNRFLLFEVAHEPQPEEDDVYGG